MNNINTTYINLLQENNRADINPNYKRYLKQLILKNIPYVVFIKVRQKNESEKLCSTKERNNIIDTALENAKDNMSNIFETARSIRKNIIKARPWKFDGSFENYSAPEMLQTLIKWIIAGVVENRATQDTFFKSQGKFFRLFPCTLFTYF